MKDTLKVININGALVAMYFIEGLKAASISARFKAGSWYEKGHDWGKAHLLEHMLFQGTKKFANKEAMDIFKEENGIWNNAWTGGAQLEMSLRMPSESIKAGLNLMTEMFFKPSVPENKIANEKRIIAQEYEDKWSRSNNRFDRKIKEQYFGKESLYIRDGLGEIKYVKNITRKELFEYQKRMIVPTNMFIGIAGNFNFKDVEKYLKNTLVYKGDKPVVNFKKVKPSLKELVMIEPNMKSAVLEIGWMFKGLDEISLRDRLKIEIVSYLLGGTSRSLLFKEIREGMGLAYEIWTNYGFYPSVTCFSIRTSVSPEKVEKLKTQVNKIIKKFVAKPINKKIFERSKSYLIMSKEMQYESSMGTAESLSSSLFWYGHIVSFEEYRKTISEIKEKEIRDFMKELFLIKKPLISIMKSKEVDITNKF